MHQSSGSGTDAYAVGIAGRVGVARGHRRLGVAASDAESLTASPPPLPPTARTPLFNHSPQRLHQREPTDAGQLNVVAQHAQAERFRSFASLLGPAVPAPHTAPVKVLARYL